MSAPLQRAVLLAAAAVAAAGLVACAKSADAQGPAPSPPPVGVSAAVQRHVSDVEEFSGRLEAIDFVQLRPRVAGTIDKVHFADGAMVRHGSVLFTIDPRPFEAELSRAQSLLASARARADLAQRELARTGSLFESQASSHQELDQFSSGARTAQAEVLGAEAALRIATLNLDYTQVRAPIDGRVSRADITAGNLVDEHSVLTSIAGIARVYVYFQGSEQTYLRLRAQRGGTAPRVRMGLANEVGLPHTGQLDFIDNRLDPQTGAIRLRAAFDNAKGEFTPGLSARLQMESPTGYDAVLVPERAIGTDQSKKFVYVVGADGKPESREIKPGAVFGAMRVVQGRILAGEKVVVDGLQRITPGVAVTPQLLPVDVNGLPGAKT
jgi:multidrug efflux system membrane fusion protein